MSVTDALNARPEFLQVADALARDKNIDIDIVLEAMEEAIQKSAKDKYGAEYDIRVSIDRKNGAVSLARYIEVTDEIENESTQMTLDEAKAYKADVALGEFIIDPLPPIDFGRVAAQKARQVIVQKVRQAEREQQYEEYKDRVGEIVNGTVKRTEFGNVIIDLGRAEAVLRRDETIPREHLRNGDRIRAMILEVRSDMRGHQVFLSRTHPDFMKALFTQEVPEIYEGQIEIRSVARDPGSRAKMAVYTSDSTMDPVGACVGLRGSRVQAVVTELQGEKVDIISWTEDVPRFVITALAPADISKVVIDEDKDKIEVIVTEDQLSLAIGRRGQNVRLASQLTGFNLDIMTEEQEKERRQAEFDAIGNRFIAALDVDEAIAHLLISEGFTKVEEVAYVALEEIEAIEGFNADIATELQNRAKRFVENRDEEALTEAKAGGLTDDLANLEGLNARLLKLLVENDIKTLDDFADLATDELLEIIPQGTLSEDEASALIMKAREHWFEE
ncbi:MAG: transcription termination factor NusA [Alphaproteobacteria bacterium]